MEWDRASRPWKGFRRSWTAALVAMAAPLVLGSAVPASAAENGRVEGTGQQHRVAFVTDQRGSGEYLVPTPNC